MEVSSWNALTTQCVHASGDISTEMNISTVCEELCCLKYSGVECCCETKQWQNEVW